MEREYSEEDLASIQNVAEAEGYPNSEVRFLVSQYLDKKMYRECIDLVDSYLHNKKIPEKKSMEIKKFRKVLIELKDKEYATQEKESKKEKTNLKAEKNEEAR